MVAQFNHGGVLKLPKQVLIKSSATLWTPVQKLFVKYNGNWQTIYQNEVVVTLTSRSDLVLAGLFTEAQWADPNLKKRVVIPAGVTIGAVNGTYAIAATYSASGQAGSWAGDLTLENHGIIQGIGGGPSSGQGGSVIWVNFPGRSGQKLIINNHGTLRSGGGGGGRGGDGGRGYVDDPYTYTEGPTYSRQYYAYTSSSWNGTHFYWGGHISSGNGFWYGDWYYYAVSVAEYYDENRTTTTAYSVARQQTRYNRRYTAGGAGGAGGRGAGHDGDNASGSPGGAGGQNAGSGGYGGSGGGWGAQGAPGATGNYGNYDGYGPAGAAGGLPGFYLHGSANALLNNYGTVLGRLS